MTKWEQIKAWFKDSETIFVARLQMLLGAALSAVAVADPNIFASLVGVKWFPLFLIGHGALVEYLRKRRADDMK